MSIKVQRLASGQIHRLYESSTHETVQVFAPVYFYDDFLGTTVLADGTTTWSTVDVGSATEAILAEAEGLNGAFRLNLSTANEAEDAVLYFGNQRPFDVANNLVFETKLKFTSSSMTGVRLVAGMAGDHVLTKDSVAEHAWFSMDGSLVLDVESDDTTNDKNSTGTTTVTTGDTHVLRIDFSDLSDVKFYVDGAAYGTDTTFDMSNLNTTGERKLQPYFALDKASGAGTCQLDIDYVRIFSTR